MTTPHVYVINLKHRTDRKTLFLKAWDAAGLSRKHLHWYSAVNGMEIPEQHIKEDFHTAARTPRGRAGRYGAYLSHTGAIATAIKHNHFPLLILEDDAIPVFGLSSNTVGRAEHSILQISSLADMFKMAPRSSSLLYFGALPIHEKKPVKDYCTTLTTPEWVAFSRDIQLYGGHAYGFQTASDAAHVLDFLLVNRITFDSALVRYQKRFPQSVSVLCPFLFRQSEGYSDIEGTVRWANAGGTGK